MGDGFDSGRLVGTVIYTYTTLKRDKLSQPMSLTRMIANRRVYTPLRKRTLFARGARWQQANTKLLKKRVAQFRI